MGKLFYKKQSTKKAYSKLIFTTLLVSSKNKSSAVQSRIADNLQALHIAFSEEELAQLNETFAINTIQGDRYPKAMNSLVPS